LERLGPARKGESRCPGSVFRSSRSSATCARRRFYIGVSEQSYYRWRREYGGLKVDQARRLKDLEQENARLKRVVADLTLDKLILKEAAEGNW